MVQQVNVINDLGALLKVPNKVLNYIIDKENLCIGSAVHDAMLAKEEAVILNIGIGTLSVELTTMQCKFVPSKDLKENIKTCITEGVDPLEKQIEKALVDKLLKVCDEVF